jgi:endonuclease/exonuclease/phosphatase family metal-dependent hydrolase
MRRVAPALGLAFALSVATLPALAAHSATPPTTTRYTASRSIGLDPATSSLGATYVSVSWNWIRSASGYQVQVAKTQDFSTIVTVRKPRNASRRPTGGRQATTVGSLRDARYYWVRVRKVSGTHKSAWTAPERVATKAHYPDPITSVSSSPGDVPGTTTIRWTSDGGYTDFFKVRTALTPFGNAGQPAEGRNARTFIVPGTARSLALTPEQTADAGAGLGTAFHLFYRITAVRQGPIDSQVRGYAHIRSATIAGEGPTTTGSPIRVASYNIHLKSRDVIGHPWPDRTPLVAGVIADSRAGIVALQEMTPGMWTTQDGGIGLQAALKNQGLGRYLLTRETTYSPGPAGDSRILYDPTRYTMVSSCPDTRISCVISVPDVATHYVPYAKFQDNASGQQFWFVCAHLTPGNDATTDALRGRQVDAIVAGMAQLNDTDLPVIFGGDLNSSQQSTGQDAPHYRFLAGGYYDTASAVDQVHMGYNTVNGYRTTESPSPYGFGSRYDTIFTLGMPGAQRFEQIITSGTYPSDHNLVFADLRLP